MTHNGSAAAAEFQKFLDYRGIVLNFPLGTLAHLGLARAYALSRATAPKLALPTWSFSISGKMPIPTSPS